MKNILYILLLSPFLGFSQTTSQNYIKKLTYFDETTLSDPSKAHSTVTYLDGLGRPIQQVAGKASPDGKDLIVHSEYDQYNREPKRYLPYEATTNNLSYDPVAKNNTANFYLTPKYENTHNPYAQDFYEASPLNRVLKSAAPGDLWAGNSDLYSPNDHAVKYDYQTNAVGEVRRFNVQFDKNNTETPVLKCPGNYIANQLFKKIIKDENWTVADGKNKTTEEFNDKEGRLILRRKYTHIPNASNPAIYVDVPHDTYYVYDDFGSLTYVIPPLAADKIVNELHAYDPHSYNYPWISLVEVDSKLAEIYDRKMQDYDNQDILNVDLLDAYGGSGGFTLLTDEEGHITLNLNITTTAPMELRNGVIATLQHLGEFEDRELGVLKGPGYEYYFLIRNNALEVQGQGKVSSVIQSLTGEEQLEYANNKSWAEMIDADPTELERYLNQIKDLNNADILSANVENNYGAIGGAAISFDEDDTFTLSVNINTTQPVSFKSGALFTLDVKRPIPDGDIGEISGNGYSYKFTLKNNVLEVTGFGQFTHFVFWGNRKAYIKYQVNEEAERLCYIYNYDKRTRLIRKHIPDNGWTYYVYDKRDMPVLTQDEGMRSKQITDADNHNWLFTKYDEQGRMAVKGSMRTEKSREVLQAEFAVVTEPLFELRSSLPTVNEGINVYYTNSTGYNSGRVLSVFYYDNYDFNTELQHSDIGEMPTQSAYGYQYTNNVKGLPTGELVRVLGTNSWAVGFTKYDDKARPVWIYSYDGYLNTWNSIETKLDFVGKTLETKTMHRLGANPKLTIYDYYTYDGALRPLKHTQKIGQSGALNLIAWNHYDKLGNLDQKKLGGTGTMSSYSSFNSWQTVDYTKNIRGWLTGVNTAPDDATASTDLFSFNISYDELFNGNIAGVSWKTGQSGTWKNYTYTYDGMNRLLDAKYRNSANPLEKYHEKEIEYDKNGNILHLERWGYRGLSGFDKIDELTYTYKPNSNQLMKVSDSAYPEGFKDGINTDNDYDYYENGNLKYDQNKDFGSPAAGDWITYNDLYLPTSLVKDNDHRIDYVYDASGTKLEKRVQNGTSIIITNYAFGFIYENGQLKYFSNDEGYVECDAGQNFTYIYSYKDHLDNVRLSFTKNSNNEVVVKDSNDYYAFGMKHQGNNVQMPGGPAQKITFGGMELQDELDLGWYDYHARNYDPALGRWFNVDPLAEKSRRYSPYAYALDNPVFFIDPDGMEATDSKVDMNNVNVSAAVATNAKKDPEVKVDIGYGRMVSGNNLTIAATFSIDFSSGPYHDLVVEMENNAHTLLDKQIDKAFPDNADTPIPLPDGEAGKVVQQQILDEILEKVPLLKTIDEMLGGREKFDMEANKAEDGVWGEPASTDARRDQVEDPSQKPYVYFYRSAFQSRREVAHTMLHEFGHVHSFLTGNFYINWIKFGKDWSAAVHADELYAFAFANRAGGRTPWHKEHVAHFLHHMDLHSQDEYNLAKKNLTIKFGF